MFGSIHVSGLNIRIFVIFSVLLLSRSKESSIDLSSDPGFLLLLVVKALPWVCSAHVAAKSLVCESLQTIFASFLPWLFLRILDFLSLDLKRCLLLWLLKALLLSEFCNIYLCSFLRRANRLADNSRRPSF